MEMLLILIGICLTIYIAVPKQWGRADPMNQPVRPKAKAQPTGAGAVKPELKINKKMEDPAWADAFVQHIATRGTPYTMTDESVRQGISEIVNNDDLSDKTKYYLLDALQMKVWNDHPQGVAAECIEDIENESVLLQYPDSDWHGRYGDWDSAKGR